MPNVSRNLLAIVVLLGILGLLFVAGWLPGLRRRGSTTDAGEVVVASWGGSYQAAQREAFWKPFQEETGIRVIESESPEHARIKAQVDSGRPEWDLVTTGGTAFLELGPEYFEPIDYGSYPEAYRDIPDELKLERTVVGATYCYAVVYRTDVFSEEQAPRTWADFWNAEKFPGPRSMALDAGVPWGSLEAAWLAAGNPPSTLDQVDLDLVFDRFDLIAPHVAKWWGSGAEALQLLASKEVFLAIATTAEIPELVEQGVPVAISWNQAICGYDNWYILRGSRNREAAQRLLAYMQDAQRQAEFMKRVYFGMPNRKAYEYLPPEVAAGLPTGADHVDQLVFLSEIWWSQNRIQVIERFNEWRLGVKS